MDEQRKRIHKITYSCDDRAELAERIVTLEDENKKLRGLCADMHTWMGRALYDGSTRRREYESITECMRELGIEVD